MKKNQASFLKQLFSLGKKFDSLLRWQLLGVVLLAFLCSAAEVASIGALYPFLSVLSGQEVSGATQELAVVLRVFPSLSTRDPVVGVTCALIVTLFVAASLRVMTTWANARLTEGITVDLSTELFRRILYQSYLRHLTRNSSEIITALSGKVGMVFNGIIAPTLMLIQAIIIAVFIIATLLVTNWIVTILMMVFLGVLYGIVIAITKDRIFEYGKHASEMSNKIVKLLQESMGGIRDVLIDNTQEVYCRQFNGISAELRRAQANIMIISNNPSYVIVTLGMIALCIFGAYVVVRDQGSHNVLPLLGMFVLGAQRLLPLLQQCYSSWSSINSSRQSFLDVLTLMEEPAEARATFLLHPIPFAHCIELENVSFRYPGRDMFVLQNLDLSIVQGQKIGFFGVTGCGKSTLMDIIMGLVPPTKGYLRVDGAVVGEPLQAAWRRNIAHVPQTIFLTDGSVWENIALGVPRNEIDIERVMRAAKGAQIADTINTWQDGFETLVGERGMRLSGGQRQRIGIARALYKEARVIVLDEATSALDSETEINVINFLNTLGSDITLLMISHSITTLAHCDIIYEISNSKVLRSGTYSELFS